MSLTASPHRPADVPVDPGASDVVLAGLVDLGNGRAFDLLYMRHAGAVRAVAVSMLRNAEAAEDLTQEVFLELWRNAGRYAAERGPLKGWLLTIAHHRAVDAVRRQARIARIAEAARGLAEIATPQRGPLAESIANDEGARLLRELVRLPGAQRDAVVLAYGGDLSHSEVARLIGVPIGTVKSRIRIGQRRLAECLDPGRLAGGGSPAHRPRAGASRPAVPVPMRHPMTLPLEGAATGVRDRAGVLMTDAGAARGGVRRAPPHPARGDRRI